MKTSIAIAALVATVVAVGAALPANADDATQPASGPGSGNHIRLSLNGDRSGPMPGMGMEMGPMRGRGFLVLACSDQGTEALDAALLHLSYRLQLTDAQKPLWDTFRSKALTTQTSFADQCKSDLPDPNATTTPDLITIMKGRLAVDQARLTAMNAVLPDFETLYNSLTDTQKDALMPRGPMRPDGMGRMPRPDGMGRMQRPDAPGRAPVPGQDGSNT